MQNAIADASRGADIKAETASRKSLENNKSKQGGQKSRPFTELMEQLVAISLPLTMEARVKAAPNDKIVSRKQGDCLSQPQTKAIKSLADSKGAKVNYVAGSEGKAEKLFIFNHNDIIPTPEDNRKSQAGINKSKLSGSQNTVSKTAPGNTLGTAGEIVPATRWETSGKVKTDVNVVNSLAASTKKQDIPEIRASQAQADIVSTASGRRSAANMAEGSPGHSEKPDFRDSSPHAGVEKQTIPESRTSKTQADINESAALGRRSTPNMTEVRSGNSKKSGLQDSNQNAGAEKQNIPESRTGKTRANINESVALGRRSTPNMTEIRPGTSEKTNYPGSNPESKVQQVLEPEQVQAQPKKADTQNHPGAIEKSGSTIDLQVVKNTESNEKAALSKPQLDSIVSNMIQQIKAAPSSLELKIKPEYLGKINILVESNGGAISIRVVAQSGEAAYLLNSNLANIRENLEQQGVKIEQIEVDLVNQEKQDNQKEGREQARQSPKPRYKNIPAAFGVVENREQIYLLPNKLNVWA